MVDTLEGVLERIVFFNEENNFTVARLQSGSSRDLITIVGNIPGSESRETLRLKGEWTVDVQIRTAVPGGKLSFRSSFHSHRDAEIVKNPVPERSVLGKRWSLGRRDILLARLV